MSIGGGVVVPYPEPLNDSVSKIGRANHLRDTKPEVRIRSAVHRRGLRFRKNFLLRVAGVRVRPDLVFTRWKVAVFVDGCFWHCCPEHHRMPTRNAHYWVPKMQRNVDRDRGVDVALSQAGWDVVRIWEHDETEEAAERLSRLLRARRGAS